MFVLAKSCSNVSLLNGKNFIFNWAILKSFVNFSGKFQIVGQKRAVSGLYSSLFLYFHILSKQNGGGGKI